jgi:hypothetical protein
LSPIGHVPVACLDFVIFQKDAAVAGLRQACVSDLGVWLWGWRRRTERERLEGRLSSAAAELARSDVSAISRVVATGPEENRRWGSGGLRAGRGGGWWLQATQRGLQQEQIEALGQALAAQADSSAARLAECTQEL